MVSQLQVASHTAAEQYWSGGEYELNLTLGTLRDKQWQRLLESLWRHESISGPYAERFVPGFEVEPAPIQIPAPTDALAQYGVLHLGVGQVGCMVLATRSLFECVTIQVPLGMFAGMSRLTDDERARLRIDPLDQVCQDMALAVFEAVPFDLANMGFQCECRLVAELQTDARQRRNFVAGGYFFARDAVLQLLNLEPEEYPLAYHGLRWVPPTA
jgi:hypothetical protein